MTVFWSADIEAAGEYGVEGDRMCNVFAAVVMMKKGEGVVELGARRRGQETWRMFEETGRVVIVWGLVGASMLGRQSFLSIMV